MKRYIVQRLLQGVVLLFMVAAIVFFLGPAHRQSGRSDAARGRHAGGPHHDDQGARARRTAVPAVPDLHRQCAARRSRHLDPHARADGGRVLLAPAEHAGDHSVGDPARHGGGHPARRGGGAQSRQHRGSRGRRRRGAGHRNAEFLARRGADLRVQRRAGLAAVGTHGRTRALRPAGDHARQLSSSPASCGWCAPACWM